MAALIIRPWILLVTYLVMHPRPNKVYETIANKVKANREIRNNNLRFYIGLVVIGITDGKTYIMLRCRVVFGFAEVFALSNAMNTTLVSYWSWAFLFSIVADFVIVDGLFIAITTLITVNVGVAPDTCGRNRACWLRLIPPAIKDAVD